MDLKEQIDKDRIPSHVAIIMDGNGRWAKLKGRNRVFGHRKGVKSVKEVTEAAAELGVKHLTLYAFSKENWQRPKNEVKELMQLLISTIKSETKTLIKNNIRLSVIGDINSLENRLKGEINEIVKISAENTGMNLNMALNYSGRWEIINAVKKIVQEYEHKETQYNDIDENYFSGQLNTTNMPDPELLIRTGGEKRISNFLLWQISYAELYFVPVLWPDFGKKDFYEALLDYQKRERRFGKISEQQRKK
jgi:undecaprenyl diphosphate synthase